YRKACLASTRRGAMGAARGAIRWTRRPRRLPHSRAADRQADRPAWGRVRRDRVDAGGGRGRVVLGTGPARLVPAGPRRTPAMPCFATTGSGLIRFSIFPLGFGAQRSYIGAQDGAPHSNDCLRPPSRPPIALASLDDPGLRWLGWPYGCLAAGVAQMYGW